MKTKKKLGVFNLINNYNTFFKFSIVLAIPSFFLDNIQKNSFLDFYKGFSASLLIVSALFKIRYDRTHETN